MSDLEKIQLFENKKIRTAWDEEKQEWFFSIVDVCGVLTEQPDYDGARKYWKVLKGRLIAEGFELVKIVTNCTWSLRRMANVIKQTSEIYRGYFVLFNPSLRKKQNPSNNGWLKLQRSVSTR